MTHDTTPVVADTWIDADGMKVQIFQMMDLGEERGLYVRVNDKAMCWWSRLTWDQWAANARRVG